MWWTFRLFGAEKAFILDGGLPKWKAERRQLETGPVKRAPRTFNARKGDNLVASLATVRAALASGSAQVVDARSPERFLGQAPEPRPGVRPGHMPGARNVPSTSVVENGRLAAPDKLCVNVMGDAAIGMTGMDIETASRNNIAILTVVFNNGVMGAEREELKISDKKYGAMTVSGNYTKVAEGLNVAARRVEKPADIVSGIKEAVAVTEKGSPFLLEFVVKEGHDFSRYNLAGL